MAEADLRELVQKLHDEIGRLPEADAVKKARLNQLVSDVEKRLDNPLDEAHHKGLVHNLEDAIRQYEVEHPSATGILNHILMTIGNMGI